MIRIVKQRVMRFGSYTNLTLDYDEETTLIGGPNGSGKSQLIEALRYAFGNTDLQRPGSASEYYIKKGLAQRMASTVTLSNVTDKGQADVFRRIQIKADRVTLGVVYEPKKDDKVPRYHIMAGDVAMPEFVEEAVAKGGSRKAFQQKLKQCHLTPAVLKHLFVQQGTAGELARKRPQELYQLVLDQSGHTETKRVYESALEEARRTQRQLDDRRRQEKEAALELKGAYQSVRELDEYEAHERRLQDLEWEERVRVQWQNRARLGRLQEELVKAQQQAEALPAQIDEVAEQIGPLSDSLAEKRRRRSSYDNDVRDARQAKRVAEEACKQAQREFDAASREHQEWLQAQPAPNVDQASREHEVARECFTQQGILLNDVKKSRDDLRVQIQAAQEDRIVVPEAAQEVLDACAGEGLTVRVLAEAVGHQSPLMEAALQPLLWNIVCGDQDLAAVTKVCKALGSTLPIVAESNSFWTQWEVGDAVETPFGIIVSPQPEPDRILIKYNEAVLQGMKSRLAALDVGVQEAKDELDAADNAMEQARKTLELARTKERLGPVPPDMTTLRDRMVKAINAAEAAREGLREIEETPPDVLSMDIETMDAELQQLEGRLEALQVKLEQHQDTIQSVPGQVKEVEEAMQEIESWEPQYQAAVQDEDAPPRRQYDIHNDWKVVKKYLDEHTKPDAEVRALYAQLESRLAYLHDEVTAIQKSHEQNMAAVEEAKTQYGQTANDALAAFKKRFEAVSKSFHVAPTVEYTRIKPGMDDDAIHDAELRITIQFGNKAPMRLQGGLSGGEGAVAGILLRLCMMNEDTAGFFIVDEPYQNLDARNVRLIAAFLEQSAYQILLVVPTSDDPNQYRGALRAFRMREFNQDGLSPPPDRLGIVPRKEVSVAA